MNRLREKKIGCKSEVESTKTSSTNQHAKNNQDITSQLKIHDDTTNLKIK